MSKQEQPQNQGLMLGDRINWPYILGMAVLKIDEALVKTEGEQSEQQVREAVLTLYDKIPEAWIKNDDQWKKDIEKVLEETQVDARPIWCGARVGKPKFKKRKKVNAHGLLRACVNVFNRRGLLSKTIFQEVMIPKPEDFEE